jgi:hypothetical protein
MIADRERFNQAIARFDAANAEDPNVEEFDGQEMPKELLYAQRMTSWLHRLDADAPEAVQLAARCQHIRRWTIPRASYPAGREGYLRWRTELSRFHAETAAGILREVGYDEEMIAHVTKLLRKRQLKQDVDVQLLEDVICLVFLENYFADFSAQHDEGKVINIVRKTWAKMSERGHTAARELQLAPEATVLIRKTLTSP